MVVPSNVSDYYHEQRDQSISSGDGWVEGAEVSSLESTEGEDSVRNLCVYVVVGGHAAVIEAADDGDGELSGFLDDAPAISEATGIGADALQSWANAVWWSARDAVFLEGLTRAEKLVGELTRLTRAD